MKPNGIYRRKDIFLVKKGAIPENGIASFFNSTKTEYFFVGQVFEIWENLKKGVLPSSPS